ncbi:PfkB family carbohydrate kinase [Actinoplanes sp. NEAU-A12]|uniref:PfkB family carbohydrate kinase n=1 Tax=Actinoplanes sandaracinus TaxID=3045177 RepID=A0ABT6WEA1_9ACTN|nr:PfkB family carbohydrate kinase [Actinoplanes sandaracinus]MDI6098047.1 PfkB family carbohydrate kinase [Actinoplanes sandaracinus]
MPYAVILGEALVDLLETTSGPETLYRTAIGGGPLNVAVGVRRLGGEAHFVGTVSEDVWGERICAFLAEAGVGVTGVRRVTAASTLALTTFAGPEPRFRFYGEPPSYGRLTPGDLDLSLLGGAAVRYAGSISLLAQPFLDAARRAWAVPGPLRVLDPNVRPALLPDDAAVAALRDVVEQFAATADLVKLSSADVAVLYSGATVPEAARRLRRTGAGAVVVTCGPDGAWLDAGAETAALPAPAVQAVDATGAGDSVMAALIARLLATGLPDGVAGWGESLGFALRVAGLVCERHGGAAAMPTQDDLDRRWGTAVTAAPA